MKKPLDARRPNAEGGGELPDGIAAFIPLEQVRYGMWCKAMSDRVRCGSTVFQAVINHLAA